MTASQKSFCSFGIRQKFVAKCDFATPKYIFQTVNNSKKMINEPILIREDIGISDTHQLLVRPSFKSHNPLASNLNIFRVLYGVKNRRKMIKVNAVDDVLQSKKPCRVWSPKKSIRFTTDELTVAPFELMEEQCGDELDESCWANLQGEGNDVNDMNASEGARALLSAILTQLRRGVGNSIHKVSWWSRPDFSDNYDLSHISDPEDRALLVDMMSQTVGLWPDIFDRVDNGLIKALDTYDGSYNAATVGNIYGFLDGLVNDAPFELQAYAQEYDGQEGEEPVILLTNDLFKAFKDYLISINSLASSQLIVNGTPVRNAYTFDGIPVMRVMDWDRFGVQMNNRRSMAMFTAPRNLHIGCDISAQRNRFTADGNEVGLRIYQSEDPEQKDAIKFYMALKLGTGVAHDELVHVAYNSTALPQ
jgi:hypothetical protein